MDKERLYYKDPYLWEFDTEVLTCSQIKGSYEITLKETAFYPEGGGQPADHGVIGEAVVLDVHEKDENVIHLCDRPVAPGTAVHCMIDAERRLDHMQQHSGEHIVSGMICSTFDCDNVGFHMSPDIITIDYNKTISWEQLLQIEERANRYIREDHAFTEVWPTQEELAGMEYRSKKELTGDVRITSFPDADTCACCGTHVKRSGEVGLIKLLSVIKFREGVRIEMLSGKRALDYLSMCFDQNRAVSRELSSQMGETHEAVIRLKEECGQLKQRIAALEAETFRVAAAKYAGAGDVLIIAEPMSPDSVRKLCEEVSESCGGRCAVFAGEEGNYKYAVIRKGSDITQAVKHMNSILSGRGGGRNGFAQGSAGCFRSDIEKFFKEEKI